MAVSSPTSFRRRRAACAVAVALVLAACSDDGASDDSGGASSTQTPSSTTAAGASESSTAPRPGGRQPEVTGKVVGHFDEPIAMIPRPGHSNELWLAERGGRVRRVIRGEDGALAAGGEPVLDISDQTRAEGERGLLGMTFADDGKVLVVSYTNLDGNSRIEAYDVDGDGVTVGSRRVLVAQDQPFPNHNGGNVVEGPDGMLWFGFGDGGAGDDPENRAQNPDTLLGKIVRFGLDGEKPEIVISGVRNPWRFAFDTDGSLWIADVGQNAIEEIDHLAPDQIEGANLGWSGYEGNEPYLDGDGRRPADAIGPVFQYTHTEGGCSITGGFPYHGKAIPALEGAYVFADFCAGDVRAITLDDQGKLLQEFDLKLHVDNPASFARSATGEIYALLSGGDVVELVPQR